MAILSEANRQNLFTEYMQKSSANNDPMPILKPDLREAVDAIDSWVDTNAAAFNSAIPIVARTALTAVQKAELLLFVVRRRWEVS